jgi:hypothetical protein
MSDFDSTIIVPGAQTSSKTATKPVTTTPSVHATTNTNPEEENTPTTAGSSPSSYGPGTLARAHEARATIAMLGIDSTIVVLGAKTTTLTTTKATVPVHPSGKGGASPPFDVDVDVERDKTTENKDKGMDNVMKSTTMHEVAPVGGWSFKTSNLPSGHARDGGGLNRAAGTATACGGTSGSRSNGGGGPERRKGFTRGGFFGGLACWVWFMPWVLLVLGGMEGVKGVAIPDCTYARYNTPSGTCMAPSCWNARNCGIRQAVDAYINSGSTGSYGPIEDWNTSLVTDMSWLIYQKTDFNANISAWQVGKVTNMERSTYTLFLPSPRSGLFMAVSISFFILCVSTNSIFEHNALSSFFFQPIFILGLFFVAVWCSVLQCCCLQS